MKSQKIRLIDVFFIGPFFMYMATREKNVVLSSTSFILGLSTIIYNGKNYFQYQHKKSIADLKQQAGTSIGVRG